MSLHVLVCGGRDFSDRKLLWATLNHIDEERGIKRIISGGARGADSLAVEWAGELWTTIYHADWKKHGRAAGPIRNQLMLDEGMPNLVVSFPGGRGTADMVRRAKAAGIEIIEVCP